MTVSLHPYPIQLPLLSPCKTLQQQPLSPSPTAQDLLQPSFDFDLAYYQPPELDSGLSLDLGGLHLRLPNPPSSPLTPLTPPDSVADLWMSQAHHYCGDSTASSYLPTPPDNLESSSIISNCSPQTPIYTIHSTAEANSHFRDDNGVGSVFSERAVEAAATMTDNSRLSTFSPSPTRSAHVPRAKSEQPPSQWRSTQSWPLGATQGTSFSPSPLRLSQLRNESFDTILTMDNSSELANTVYPDGLYSPDFPLAPTSFDPSIDLSPSCDVLLTRLSVANLYLNSPASACGTASFDFQQESPMAPATLDDVAIPGDYDLNSCFRAETDSSSVRSPHDALLEFPDPNDGTENLSLFPSLLANDENGADFWTELSANTSMLLLPPDVASFPQQINPHAGSLVAQNPFSRLSFDSSSPASSIPLDSHHSSDSELDEEELFSADSPLPALVIPKPFNTNTGEGTYSCTYHGCTLRFETPTLLQKHKREGHRQHHGLAGLRKHIDVAGFNGNSMPDSQAGPHHCDRIHPSTNKPCGAIFSRPYDLTRHEDTIHNVRKTKSRCQHCEEEKTFSRADALRRHYRVCHPQVEIVPKHRRRPNGSSSSVDSKPLSKSE